MNPNLEMALALDDMECEAAAASQEAEKKKGHKNGLCNRSACLSPNDVDAAAIEKVRNNA